MELYKFRKNVLLSQKPSLTSKILFHIFGHDFIGAEIRLAHFSHNIKRLPLLFGSLLDAGCGTGDFSFYIAKKYPNCMITAIDITKDTLQQNRRMQKELHTPNISFTYQDLSTMKEKEKYNFVFCIGTLIYFPKKKTKEIVINFTTSLKRGGYLYLDLPQENFFKNSIIPTKYYSSYHTNARKEISGELYTYYEIQKLLKELGYIIVHTSKSFGFVGKLSWELDNVLNERKWYKTRLLLFPLLKFLATLDAQTKNKNGSCFVILAQKL